MSTKTKTTVEAWPHTIRVMAAPDAVSFGVITQGQKADRHDILDVIVKGLAAQNREIDVQFRDGAGREVKREEWLKLP